LGGEFFCPPALALAPRGVFLPKAPDGKMGKRGFCDFLQIFDDFGRFLDDFWRELAAFGANGMCMPLC